MVTQYPQNSQRILRAIIYLTVLIPLNQAANYDGYKVYQSYPDTARKIAILKSLNGVTGYDFWQEPRGNAVKLMVAPKQQKIFEALMAWAQIRTAVVVYDVAAEMRKDGRIERNQRERTGTGRRGFRRNWRSFSFDQYLRYNEMWELVETMVSGKSTAELFVVGRTSQGRKILAVKLSTSDDNPAIVIDGGIHAREWAAPMSVLYVLQRLIENEEVLKKLSFYIVPLVNPDGYEYTHLADRLWRKTMSNHSATECLGVDLNRNFDSHWNEFGSESNPCSSVYSGPNAFSELESKAMRDLIETVKPVMYLTFHTFGGLILYPWGFTSDLPPNWQELDSLGKKAAAEVERIFGTRYTVGSSKNVLYAASGASDDWAMEKAGVPLVFCVELEDFGTYFELPTTKLKQVVQHADTMVQVFVNHVENKYWSQVRFENSTSSDNILFFVD